MITHRAVDRDVILGQQPLPVLDERGVNIARKVIHLIGEEVIHLGVVEVVGLGVASPPVQSVVRRRVR